MTKSDDPAPRYEQLTPASEAASRAARATSKTRGTKPELVLAKALWAAGCRYRKHARELPGTPDLVFRRQKIAVFVDGDFWHGRHWLKLRERLAKGHNSAYWLAKIERNRRKDGAHNDELAAMGWWVLRFWESDIKADVDACVARVLLALDAL